MLSRSSRQRSIHFMMLALLSYVLVLSYVSKYSDAPLEISLVTLRHISPCPCFDTLLATSGDSAVPSYRIEVFTASSTVSAGGSKFGQSEVQTIATAHVAEGTFTLAFGHVDHALPGTVDAVNGEDFVITSEDLTPYVKRGDRVALEGLDYEVHAFMPFDATHLYLAQVLNRAGITAWLEPSLQITTCSVHK